MDDVARAHYGQFRRALAQRDDLRRVGHATSTHLEISAFAVPTITLAELAKADFGFEDAPFAIELRGAAAEDARYQPPLPYDDCWTVWREDEEGQLVDVGEELVGHHHRSPPHEYVLAIPPDMMAESFVQLTSLLAPLRGMVRELNRGLGRYVFDVAPLHCEAGGERVDLAPLRFEVEIVR